ncbi:MAG: hypothetical protein ACYC3I_06020 [Gemmataceae bacterium]
MSTIETEAFADFERDLRQWLARSEQTLVEPVPLQTAPVLSGMFAEHLKRLQTYLDKAERDVEQVATPLTDDIQALRQWLDALSMARTKVTDCTVPSPAALPPPWSPPT